jgi:hypothetical protein
VARQGLRPVVRLRKPVKTGGVFPLGESRWRDAWSGVYPEFGLPERFESVKDLLFVLLFVAVWLVLQIWVLPRLGIRT